MSKKDSAPFRATVLEGPSREELADAFLHVFDVSGKTVLFTVRVEAPGPRESKLAALVMGLEHEGKKKGRYHLSLMSVEWGVCKGVYDPLSKTGSLVMDI